MTFPVDFHFFGHAISAHQVLELLAYAAGFQLYLFIRRRWAGTSPRMTVEQTAWVVIGAIFGALIGAKLLAWAESFPLYWSHRGDWRILLGGKTIVGAILGGWVGVQIAKLSLRIAYPSGDVYVFPVILGMCIGRVGCFLAGLEDHTYGIATGLPWGVDFGDGISRHPTQLYEAAFLLATGGFFLWRILTHRQRGCMFSQFVLAYLAFRFGVEFLKPRLTVPVIYLSAIQITSLGGMVLTWMRRNDQCCGVARTPGAAKDAGPSGNAGAKFVELTNSLCAVCLEKVEAKILLEGHAVYLQKFCPRHGVQRVLIADDAAYWEKSRRVYKPPTAPLRRNTEMRRGCPFDCGLCPDHEQHSCLAIVEVTDQCDLACPVCYAASNGRGTHRSLAEIEFMLDSVVANEGRVNLVQISGGEPTQHPEFFAILDAVRARPIRHLMVNTNGRRIAEDAEFVAQLAKYSPGFELYLQFDSLRPESLRKLRGQDLSGMRRKAIEALNRHGISTTLVVTLMKGVNDGEIGEILDFALAQPCVRGVTFQPVQAAGRLPTDYVPAERLTLSAVRSAILQQHKLFTPRDLVPVPCHTDALAMGYAIRRGRGAIPLSKLVDPESLLNVGGNTICYEQDPALRQHVHELFSAAASPASAARNLNMLCCLRLAAIGKGGSPISYDQIFRVIIMQFMDAHSMDLRSVKRACVHIVHPDGRLIPFDTYNLLYRNSRCDAADAREKAANVQPTEGASI